MSNCISTSTGRRNSCTGKHINNAEVSVESDLTAILGRMASCEERAVSLDEVLPTNQQLEAGLKQ